MTAAQDQGNEGNRLPVEIAVALDVSGSMSGKKIELCKDTLNLILKYLLPKDKITMRPDTDVTRCFDLLPMDDRNKQRYESTVKKLRLAVPQIFPVAYGCYQYIKKLGNKRQHCESMHFVDRWAC